MLIGSFVFAVLIEVLLPLGLGLWVYRRYGARWGLFGVGVLTFIGSQLVHIPLVIGWQYITVNDVLTISDSARPLINAAVLGLLAGLCEEPARLVGLLVLRRLGRRWDSLGSALMLGLGHGGVESILVGLSVGVNYIVMLIMSARPEAQLPPGLDASAIEAFWGMAWHLPLAGAVERIWAVTLHVTLSVMVWRALSRRQWGWLALAILWHGLIDMAAVILVTQGWSAWKIEGVLGILTLVNLAILFRMWTTAQDSPPQTDIPLEPAG
mgnify:CR=1 FL=1